MTALAAAWACTFPDVTFRDDAALDRDASDDAAAALDALGLPSDSEDSALPPLLIDGSSIDVLVVDDAGGKLDAASCASCDCDKDTWDGPDCGAAPANVDCDESDTRSHPLQGFLADKPESPRFGDWDCNGQVEKLYPRENASCEGLTLGFGCSDIFGFTEPVACGNSGNWIRCKKRPGVLTLDCVLAEQRFELQRCR